MVGLIVVTSFEVLIVAGDRMMRPLDPEVAVNHKEKEIS